MQMQWNRFTGHKPYSTFSVQNPEPDTPSHARLDRETHTQANYIPHTPSSWVSYCFSKVSHLTTAATSTPTTSSAAAAAIASSALSARLATAAARRLALLLFFDDVDDFLGHS